MDGSCCSRPAVKKITVGAVEVGVMGLDEIFNEALASGLTDDQGLMERLVALARQQGNYISPSREALYGPALLGQYRAFQAARDARR